MSAKWSGPFQIHVACVLMIIMCGPERISERTPRGELDGAGVCTIDEHLLTLGVVRRPECEVVAKELHDEGRVLV